MRSTTLLLSLGILTLSAITLGACAAALEGAPAVSGDRIPDASDQLVIEGSAVKPYLSASEIAGDATSLLLGNVVAAEAITISDLQFTGYEVRVESHLAGSTPDSIVIYQIGEADSHVDLPIPQHLLVGERYILFVQPTGVEKLDSADTGYYIVGPGAWVNSQGSRFDIWLNGRSDVNLGEVPTNFDWAETAAILQATLVGTQR